MRIKRGQTLAQRYEIREQLGSGGSAKVYLAYDMVSGRLRAIKEISQHSCGRNYVSARREAEIVWKLKYPYFPEIFEILDDGGSNYIVMEYLQGETAAERLHRLGPLPAMEVIRWAKDLCLMLSYLHCHTPPMVYCDMKPDNIMIQSGGTLRLIDFGAVLEMDRKEQQLLLGTRGYAAPEQFDSEGVLDARTDIYGLGMTMYQLLTGKEPDQAEAEKILTCRFRPFMPRRFARVIRKCIEKEPRERYQTCEELWKALS